MATVALTNTSTRFMDVPDMDRSWWAAYTGNDGSTVTVRVPRSHPAASSLYIAPDGGSTIQVQDDTAGAWFGIVDEVEEDAGEIVLTAVQPAVKLSRMILKRRDTVTAMTAGAIASLALKDTIPTLRGLSMGNDWFVGSTIIPTYTFDGQTCMDVLTDMMAASGDELHITASGVVWWAAPLAFASSITTLLVDGSNFHTGRRLVRNSGRLSEVTAINGNEQYTAIDGTAAAAGWAGQTAFTTDATGAALVSAARTELQQRVDPTVEISGRVGPALWSIRERDFVTVHLPWAGFTGRTYNCRVLGRRLSGTEMDLALQVIPTVTASSQSSGAAGRVRPSMRVSRDGRAGSFVQRQRQLRRTVTMLERGA